MARFALGLLAFVALFSVVAADIPFLPTLPALPLGCGATVQVLETDDCQSIADYGGITVDYFGLLNPLEMCDILPLVPGAPVCVGDRLASCNNLYVTQSGDTCQSIAGTFGRVIGMPLSMNCTTLVPGTTVCIAPATNQCAQNTICGKSIPTSIQTMLAGSPDYCRILKECQATVTVGTQDGKPSLTMTIKSVTPAVNAVKNNPGHPEIAAYVAKKAAGENADLTWKFVPGWYPNGDDLIDFTGTTAVSSKRRKLLATYGQRGQFGRAYYRYY